MIATTEQVITEEFQESPPDIVKVRVMGTKEDINWISALLKTNPFFHVIDQSDIYSNHGTKKYFRSYLQIARKEVKHDLNAPFRIDIYPFLTNGNFTIEVYYKGELLVKSKIYMNTVDPVWCQMESRVQTCESQAYVGVLWCPG